LQRSLYIIVRIATPNLRRSARFVYFVSTVIPMSVNGETVQVVDEEAPRVALKPFKDLTIGSPIRSPASLSASPTGDLPNCISNCL
jgi:hypothetical protein